MVAADTDSADEFLAFAIQGQPTAENVNAADSVSDHRVVGRAPICRGSGIGDLGIDRIALLQAEETAARLHRGIKIRSRDGQAFALS